ncbi:hypothetical protein KR222_003545 [Zaprionus bogoriensis]|nr:hypothetical protein KR222_003545 [Zaprionus bogoriensis]
MENQVHFKREGANFKNENADNELTPLRDQEPTPLRDERDGSPAPASAESAAAHAVAASGWDSDTEDQHVNIPAPPSPPSPPAFTRIRIKKRSPSFDEPEYPSTSAERDDPPESQAQIAPFALPSTGQMLALKKEERPELPLGFLDALSEADFEGVPSAHFQRNELDQMDLDLPSRVEDNEKIEQDIKRLSDLHSKLSAELNSKPKKKKKKKKKKHADEENRKRRHSSSASPVARKAQRLGIPHGLMPEVKVPTAELELDYVPLQECEKRVKVIHIKKLLPEAAESTPVPAAAAAPLPVKEKRRLAVERVKTVLSLLQLKASKAPEQEFLVVDTIRQLPVHTSLISCAIFENPSPLCNNFNVRYKFNSTSASNISLTKWGLEAMPAVTGELLRLTGISVTRLMELKESSKMPLQKLRLQEQAERAANKAIDECVSTGLYSSVSTQTDGRLGQLTRDVGVQAMPVKQPGIYWLESRFTETDLSQQHANVMLALKELCASAPRSSYWADELFQALLPALAIKRSEQRTLSNQ